MNKKSNVSTAGGSFTAPGSSGMPGAGYGGKPGAVNIPGASVHCLKCFGKVEGGAKKCPICGNDVSRVSELASPTSPEKDYASEGPTGAEAAESEARAQTESHSSMGKYSNADLSWRGAPKPIKVLAGLLSAGAGTYGAVKLNRFFKDLAVQPQGRNQGFDQGRLLDKVARAGNPIFNLRKPTTHVRGLSGGDGTVLSALERLRKAARKTR